MPLGHARLRGRDASAQHGRLDPVELLSLKAQRCCRWVDTGVAFPLTVQNELLQAYRDVGAHCDTDPPPGIRPGRDVICPKVSHQHVRLLGEPL
jgi:hypothetical protein